MGYAGLRCAEVRWGALHARGLRNAGARAINCPSKEEAFVLVEAHALQRQRRPSREGATSDFGLCVAPTRPTPLLMTSSEQGPELTKRTEHVAKTEATRRAFSWTAAMRWTKTRGSHRGSA
eukprot:1349658-Pleurochrysis_carterae.AAC.2